MTTCQLTYFNFWALGEPIRLILAFNSINFIDKRLDRFGKEWEEAKPTFKFGQLPLLEIDGLELYHSKAICRYLGNKYNLNGQSYKDEYEIDMAVDTIYDFIMKMRSLREISDPVEKECKYQEFKLTVIPTTLKNLDSMVKNGHLACEELTWADFYFTGAAHYLSNLARLDIFEGHTNLKSVYDKVISAPQLTDYITNRVELEF